jgi:hypothetical protein
MTCTHTSTLGVYLLGALEPEDRSTFEAHLSGCDVCRSELVRLAPLPGLLNQITLADFEDATRTAQVEAQLLAPVAELPPPVAELPEPLVIEAQPEPDTPAAPRPGRRYWQIAAAAALVILLTVGGIVGYQALTGLEAEHQTVTWSATNPATGAHADVELSHRSWGTQLKVWMSNIPTGRNCKLVVRAKSGYRNMAEYKETAGWWGTDAYDPHEEIPTATSIDMADIYTLQFVDNNDEVLVDLHRPTG